MKNLLFFAAIGLLVSCNPQETEPTTLERSIGFNTELPELKWHLGTEEAIQLVKDFDKAWETDDYKALKSFLADTVKCYYSDGSMANSADEYVESLQGGDDGSEYTWTFDYAFSVDLDPTQGGEHVQAGFTGTATKDGVELKKYALETYYIIEGKIVTWRQYAIDNIEE